MDVCINLSDYKFSGKFNNYYFACLIFFTPMGNNISVRNKEGECAFGLSVVIVSYNCRDFLRLCLDSLLWAKRDDIEVIVVDNASTDSTVQLLKNDYPTVVVVENSENVGFGKACNQGMQIAQGRYLLMLNPDTIAPEDLADRVYSFMDSHLDCGAMGVYMADGCGNYLPESKRMVPTLFNSFCKFSGLARLFPRSGLLALYYAGHIRPDQTAEVEILAGAFMALRREAVEAVGGFDEDYFMYGEDVDLSWRMVQLGWKIYYNPEITIIHFKGESSSKAPSSIKAFYKAMETFYAKHYDIGSRGLLMLLVRISARLLLLNARLRRLIWGSNLRKLSYPIKGDYLVFSDNPDSIADEVSRLVVGNHIKTEEVEKKKRIPVCILDLSTCHPSKIIDFVRIKGFFCRNILWLNRQRTHIIHPFGASERTIVTTLD